jgi:hypothetical protein
MSRSITLEIPEADVSSLEAAIEQALEALRHMDDEANEEREERITRLRAETHVLMEQIRAELYVEETV